MLSSFTDRTFDLLPAKELFALSKTEARRLSCVRYYDPSKDLRFSEGCKIPPGKYGFWYCPTAETWDGRDFELSAEQKQHIAQRLLGSFPNFPRPPTTSTSSPRSTTSNMSTSHLHRESGHIRSRDGIATFPAIQESISSDDDEDSSDDDMEPVAKAKISAERKQLLCWQNGVKRFFQVDVNLDPETNTEDQITVRAFCSVGPSTAYQYASCLRQVLAKGYPLTRQGFTLFMNQPVLTIKAGTVGQYGNAFEHYAKSVGLEGPTARCKLLTEAREKEAGLSETTRGSITQDMVHQLVHQPAVKAQARTRAIYILLSATGVRSNQLKDLRLSDVTPDPFTPGIWRISVKRNFKGRMKRTAANANEIHFTNPFWRDEIHLILAETRGRINSRDSNPYLCPTWLAGKGFEERLLLSKEAKKLGWSTKLSWVPHSFRNGAACDAFLRYADQGAIQALAEVKKMTGHISLEMLRHYAIPNSERIKYHDMKLDESLLRVTGVICNDLEGVYCPQPRGTGLVANSSMSSVGNQLDWQLYVQTANRNAGRGTHGRGRGGRGRGGRG